MNLERKQRGSYSDPLCSSLLLVPPQGLFPKSLNSHHCVAQAVHQSRKCANPFPLALAGNTHMLVWIHYYRTDCVCALHQVLHTTDWKHPSSFSIQTWLKTCFLRALMRCMRNVRTKFRSERKNLINPWPRLQHVWIDTISLPTNPNS